MNEERKEKLEKITKDFCAMLEGTSKPGKLTPEQIESISDVVAAIAMTMREVEIVTVAHAIFNEDSLKKFILLNDDLSVDEIVSLVQTYTLNCASSCSELMFSRMIEDMPMFQIPFAGIRNSVPLSEFSKKVLTQSKMVEEQDDGEYEYVSKVKELITGSTPFAQFLQNECRKEHKED